MAVYRIKVTEDTDFAALEIRAFGRIASDDGHMYENSLLLKPREPKQTNSTAEDGVILTQAEAAEVAFALLAELTNQGYDWREAQDEYSVQE